MDKNNILVVRSGSLSNLLMVLESLGRRFPRSEITVLTDPDILDELSRHPASAAQPFTATSGFSWRGNCGSCVGRSTIAK